MTMTTGDDALATTMLDTESIEDGLIPGVYNYCDRWCEYCPVAGRCALRVRELGRRAAHVRAGRDPDRWETGLTDVTESFQETIELIRADAERWGIDLDAQPVAEEPSPFKFDHPLVARAHSFTVDAYRFVQRLDRADGVDVGSARPGAGSSRGPDALDILAHYALLVGSKIHRAVGGREPICPAGDFDELMQSDCDGSAKVAHRALARSIEALVALCQRHPALREPALSLITRAHQLVEAVDREFPGHKTFKRPGFDV